MATRKQPTHSVTHRNGRVVNIYIAPTLAQQLLSRDAQARTDARSSICIRFRKAYAQKFSGDTLPRVEWEDIVVRKLTAPTTSNAVQPGATAQQPQPQEKRCCPDDDCVVCDQGNHGWCRKGCTL